ncbi:hypothetical protein CPC08DRAFT_820433 [Agrocybe pediades]|nr:hypothetical protein CPC08DRAFT_820433 [Agrocybe pediades]
MANNKRKPTYPSQLGFGRAKITKRKLRVLFSQLEKGDLFFREKLQNVTGGVDTLIQGISTIRDQLSIQNRRFQLLRKALHAFAGEKTAKLVDGDASYIANNQSVLTVYLPLDIQATASIGRSTKLPATPPTRKRKRFHEDDQSEDEIIATKRRLLSFSHPHGTLVRKELRSGSTIPFKGVIFEDISSSGCLLSSQRNLSSCYERHSHSSNFSPVSHITYYPAFDREVPESKCNSPPHPSGWTPNRVYSYEDYNWAKKEWVVVRDYRSTDRYKSFLVEEAERGWSTGNLRSKLRACVRAVDTLYEFAVDWEDFSVPYSGDDLVITSSHPEYPPHLRGKPPPTC